MSSTTETALPDAAASAMVDSPVAMLSVGDRLRAAREANKMSLDDVSQAIKIPPRVLQQVEGNAWAQLPGYTFARGVVRSYARLVKLDPETLLRDLDGAPMPKPPALELRPSTQASLPVPGEANKRDRFAMLAGVMLVAVAVIAYFMVPEDWFGMPAVQQARTPVAPEPAVAAPVPVPPPALAAVPATPILTPPADPALAAPSVAAAVPAATTENPGAAAPPPAPLVLRFDEASWAEVRDHKGALLISENVAPGSERQLGGEAPYNIWLGNADGVRLSYRGQPVDLKPHTRQKVARLVLE